MVTPVAVTLVLVSAVTWLLESMLCILALVKPPLLMNMPTTRLEVPDAMLLMTADPATSHDEEYWSVNVKLVPSLLS